ncbi:flagellar basal body P-ring formation chaperone FlgA [Pseudoroseomonas cervicalis]|uniref:flagellar basal body P-ring formation chaperone FlgA n=1 Tax=Teichococcus cervicalis TaxID=204525 RepID=UPI0022F1BD81|nr:flagellar basal body P-ring formation chaperone FlgA [Pseudoroseomonas cervicalis]WBV44572.1 flagellar basal body P-ring formation chaperone FlgA [Pseudoroseomonas cervicalis]
MRLAGRPALARRRSPRLAPALLALALALPAGFVSVGTRAQAPGAATAATPGLVAHRPLAVIEGGSVTLGDLFENAGPRATDVLGPSPMPGRRFVVEAPQLAVIARDAGLPWQPAAGDERVVVERPGRPLSREEVEAVLRGELARLGADPELDIDLVAYQPMLVPTGADPRLTLEGTEYDAASRRFSATLVVLADGVATLRQRLAGRSVAMRSVVVANRALRMGEVLGAPDVRAERLPAERLRPGLAESLDAVLGRRLGRPLGAGQPVPLSELSAQQAVRRDSVVQLVHEATGLSLTTSGRALEDGALGATITILNLSNGAVLLGEVLAPGRVRALGPAPEPQTATARGQAPGLVRR